MCRHRDSSPIMFHILTSVIVVEEDVSTGIAGCRRFDWSLKSLWTAEKTSVPWNSCTIFKSCMSICHFHCWLPGQRRSREWCYIAYRDVTIQGHPHTEVISKARYDEIILLWLICKPYGTETEFWICSFACQLFRALTTHKITTLTQN